MKFKVVHITWLDSSAANSWTSPEEQEPLTPTHSVGFLIKKTKNSVVLALSYDPDTEEMNCFKHIPLIAIAKMKTICTIQTTTTKNK